MKSIRILVVFLFGLYSCKHKAEVKVVPPVQILFGIDVSQYQGDIKWDKVKQDKDSIKFVLIRATMGSRKDCNFQENVTVAKDAGFIVGAYHYYDPNEPSSEQAANYLSSINLVKGDFIPIVDLERLSNCQSEDRLRKGLKNWLSIVEKKYGVKPILYSGYSFFSDCLLKDFADYPLWVAAYSEAKKQTPLVQNCSIHQFAKKVKVAGIPSCVDGDNIKLDSLQRLILQ